MRFEITYLFDDNTEATVIRNYDNEDEMLESVFERPVTEDSALLGKMVFIPVRTQPHYEAVAVPTASIKAVRIKELGSSENKDDS